ncbi:MAG: helix-turn-helix domain-containing protein [Planctomycetota bacterium]|nr:helix-turn-helix domain-containing protein [Planctomycetota bacterium]
MSEESTNEVEQATPLVITQLAELPARTLLDEAALASILQVTPRTVRNLASQGHIPPAFSIGKRSVWIVGKLLDYLEERAAVAMTEGHKREKNLRVVG